MYGRMQLLVVAAAVLALVGVAWFARAGLWRRGRLLPIALALAVGLGVLSRRIGAGELVVIAAVVLVPMLLLGPGRSPR